MFDFCIPLILTLAGPAYAQDKPTYDPGADAEAAVAHATELAAKKNKRVLVVWGHDGKAGDVELFTALRHGKTEAWPFYYEYELVAVDSGADGGSHAELARSLGVAEAARPHLTILDAAGQPLANRAASGFRAGEAWNRAALGELLSEHAVEPLDAEQVMQQALERAKAESKRLFVHLGAPW